MQCLPNLYSYLSREISGVKIIGRRILVVSLAGSFNVIGMEIILRILMQARCDPKKM
jgi:hypothetical protein